MTDFLKELRQANLERQAIWPGAEIVDGLFRAVELGNEAGETLGAVKKLYRHDRSIAGNRKVVNREDLFQNLRDEIGDTLISLDLLAIEYGISLEEVTRSKFNQTSESNGLDILI